ncbi:hypothetical protein F8S13_22760 [Chloroflexia bacterium SDU3-3]|nr:hypothetical protein F8S13_22760 [Chloroflexia bacterium SDU3-3]
MPYFPALRARLLACLCGLCLALASCATAPDAKSTTPTALTSISAQGISLPGRLLFVRGGDIWQWQGGTGSQLTQQGNLAQPSWSPDGSRIACIQRGNSYSDIVLLSATGDSMLPLTHNDSAEPPNSQGRVRSTIWALYPSFAPDGGTIAYTSQAGPATGEPAADYNLALYTMPAAQGGQRTQRYASDTGQVGRAAYAPDGALALAFQPTGGDARPQILRLTQDQAAPIDGLPDDSYDPAFSPDGTWLAFATRRGQATDLAIIPAGGGSPTTLTSIGSARAPAFSPDGAWLAFLALSPGSSSFDLWVAPLTLSADSATIGEPKALTSGLQLDPDSGLSWGR